VLLGKGLQEFTPGTDFGAIGLVESAADALDGFEEFLLLIEELLIGLCALHNHFGLAVDCKSGGLASGLEFADVIAGIAARDG
jgi:hypothetical protein